MEKQNPSSIPSIVRHNNHNGVVKLPPGFRFHPTDEELVLQYLRRKLFSYPLPASIIPEIDLARHNPWDLPGGCEQERYFFALREAKYANGNRTNRATECGYWKATGKDRVVVATKCGRAVGLKKTLVFYHGKAPIGQKTDWIMHEYRLNISNPRSCGLSHMKNSTLSDAIEVKDWVLCRIFKKKRSAKASVEQEEHRFIDFMGRGMNGRRSSLPAHSDSSCVTDHASDESKYGEEITSSSYP